MIFEERQQIGFNPVDINLLHQEREAIVNRAMQRDKERLIERDNI